MKEKLKVKENIKIIYEDNERLVIKYFVKAEGIRLLLNLMVKLGFYIIGIFLLASLVFMMVFEPNPEIKEVSIVIAIFIIIGYVVMSLIKSKEKLTIIKGKGLKFKGQKLPFDSIDDIDYCSKSSKKLYLQARVRGNYVRITGFVDKPIADRISELILANIELL